MKPVEGELITVSSVDPAAVAALADFPDAEFEQLVLANASPRRRNQQLWDTLLSPDIISRTYGALVDAFQRNVAAITARRELEESRTLAGGDGADESTLVYLDWRKRAASFNDLVTSALSEVNKRRQQLSQESDDRAAERYRRQIRDLALAIAAHQQSATGDASGSAPKARDTQLWGLLDSVHLPHGPAGTPTPLRTLVNTHWYHSPSTG